MSDQYDVIMIGAGPSAIFCAYDEGSKEEPVQNEIQRYVLDVNHVLLQQDLPEQEHSQMVNYPYPQM